MWPTLLGVGNTTNHLFWRRIFLGRDIREGFKPTEPRGKEEKEEEDQILTQLKKTQAYVSVWGC